MTTLIGLLIAFLFGGAGIVMMLLAIAALQHQHGWLPRPVTVLLNPDEEIGSKVSRKITERLAKKSQAVLVLEPSAGPKGACKTARKGVGATAPKPIRTSFSRSPLWIAPRLFSSKELIPPLMLDGTGFTVRMSSPVALARSS